MARLPLDSFVNSKPSLDSFLTPKTVEAPEPNYFERVGSEFSRIGGRIVSDITKAGTEAMETGGPAGGAQLLRAGLRTVGGVAEAAFAPVLEAPGIKQVTEAIAGKVAAIPGAADLIRETQKISEKYPDQAQDLSDIINIATLGIGKTVEGPLAKETRAVGEDIVAGTRALLTPSEEAVQNKVISLFQKSIKPTAKKTLAQGEKYSMDTLTALKTIKANADNLNIEDFSGELITGRVPQSINELAQGLDQTKKLVFTQYDDLAKKATGAGASVDAVSVADEVAQVAQNRALQLTNPAVVDYAKGWETRLRDMGAIDAQTAQEAVQMMNANLQAFYRNPTYDTASKVAVDAGIANNLRQGLDKAIEGATGEQYTALKRQYGALKAIENDVVRASMREGRKNARGLLDYTDIFTGGQMVGGILSLNPAMFTKGAVERGFKEYIKYLNDPNRAIKNIFDKLNTGGGEAFVPKSATFQSAADAIKNPRLGLGLEDVSKNQEFQRLQSMTSDTTKMANSSKSGTGATSTTIPKELQPLAAEAKKYKSAEEFVKARPVVYHGSPVPLKKFSNKKGGVYFTEEYADATGFAGTPDNVYEGYLNFKKPLVIDAKGKKWDELNTRWGKSTQEVVGNAKKEGYDGVTFKNVIDNAMDDADAGTPGNIYFAFEPETAFVNESQLTDLWNKVNKKK